MPALSDRQGVSISDESAWLMLDELNHRVGNELMAALAALRTAQRGARNTDDPTAFLDQAVVRLENFGQVHQILNRNRGHGSVSQRLEALCRATEQSKAAPLGIHIVISAEEVEADDETGWTLCVVASELMTNAFKHAFWTRGECVVSVDLHNEQDCVILIVADNGVGSSLPPSRPALAAPGLGWGIVSELADRLGGAVVRESGSTGTTVTVRVPGRRQASPAGQSFSSDRR